YGPDALARHVFVAPEPLVVTIVELAPASGPTGSGPTGTTAGTVRVVDRGFAAPPAGTPAVPTAYEQPAGPVPGAAPRVYGPPMTPASAPVRASAPAAWVSTRAPASTARAPAPAPTSGPAAWESARTWATMPTRTAATTTTASGTTATPARCTPTAPTTTTPTG